MALVYALVRGDELGWTSTQTLLTLALAGALLVTFVVLQRRLTYPLVPGPILRSSSVVGADVSALLIGAAIFAIFFFLTLYLQILQGYSPIPAGFAYLPMTLVTGISAGIASNLLGRIGPRPIWSPPWWSRGQRPALPHPASPPVPATPGPGCSGCCWWPSGWACPLSA